MTHPEHRVAFSEFYEDAPRYEIGDPLASIRREGIVVSLYLEQDTQELWLAHARQGSAEFWRVGRATVRGRPLSGTSAVALGGSFADMPGHARVVTITGPGLREDAGVCACGWLAILECPSLEAAITITWADSDSKVHEQLRFPRLDELLDTGPTYYGPPVKP